MQVQARVIADNITYTDEHVLMLEDEVILAMISFKSKEYVRVNLISKKQRCIKWGKFTF